MKTGSLLEILEKEGIGTLEELGDEEILPSAEDNAIISENTGLIGDLQESYENLKMPIAILDASLNFIFRNRSFLALMRSFRYPEKKSFLAAFSRAFTGTSLKNIFNAVHDPIEGFSWKGTIHHHSHDASSVTTRIYLLPYMHANGNKKPLMWTVFFEDVTEENKKLMRGYFSSLLEASKLKDNDTGYHIERVSLYSQRLAIKMYGDRRWPEVDLDFIESIGFLAAMHDVGKIGTPDDILNKQGPLNDYEWSIMKEHTINGAFILAGYPHPMAKQIAQFHHEWWNGRGYPYKLVGDMIPLAARIVAIADVYDALRMPRSYKPAFDHGRSCLLINADSNLHFDPDLVAVFKTISREFDSIFEKHKDDAD